jgi:hypothetical protein
VERVEVKDAALPESMKRSMPRQAEAERERRARIISADGEYQASGKLAQAATVMAADPAVLQLRLLQTAVEVAAEKNSTLLMPVPVELLRFFDRAALAPGQAEPSTAGAPPPVPEIPALTVPTSLPASAAVTAPLNAAQKHQPPSDRHRTGCVPICTGQQALLADAALPWRASPSPQRRPGGQPSAAEAGTLPATLQ